MLLVLRPQAGLLAGLRQCTTEPKQDFPRPCRRPLPHRYKPVQLVTSQSLNLGGTDFHQQWQFVLFCHFCPQMRGLSTALSLVYPKQQRERTSLLFIPKQKRRYRKNCIKLKY